MIVGIRGDIAIYKSGGSIWDRLVSLGERNSPYVHAAIVIDSAGTVVQALPKTGIAKGHLPDDAGRYVVLDPRTLGATDAKITNALQGWLIPLSMAGITYGYSDIAYQVVKYILKRFYINKVPWHKDEEPDCSNLCAQYLIMAGATVPWTVETCYQATPADLYDLTPAGRIEKAERERNTP